MANPFFIPDQFNSYAQPLNEAAQNLIRMKSIQEQGRIADQSNQRLLEQQEYQKPYYQALAQKANNETPFHAQNYKPSYASMLTNKLKPFGAGKSLLVQKAREYGLDPNINNYLAYKGMRENWPEYQTDLINILQDNLDKELEKNPNYLQTEKGRRHETAIEELVKDPGGEFIDRTPFGSEVLRSRRMQDENSKAAIAEQQALMRQTVQELKNKGWQNSIEQRIAAQKEIHDAKLAMQEKLNEARIASRETIAEQKANKIKEPTPMDIKHVDDMINNATGGGKTEPSASSVELIRKTVAPWGYDYQPVTKTVPGFMGVGTTQETKWQLIPKKIDGAYPIADVDTERKQAEEAIRMGKDANAVKAYFKQRTGKDF